MRSPIIHYILATTKKLQALIRHDRESFQDTRFLHMLARKEFGPMAAGIVGASEDQIEELERILETLKQNGPLFDAFIKSFIFQDVGRSTTLRDKYQKEINPADLAQAGAFFVEKERIHEKYHLEPGGEECLLFLIRHHGLVHHIVRGELSFSAIQETLAPANKELFDAFFVFSFIMLSALREDLIREDLAERLFAIRAMCHKIIDGETTLNAQLETLFHQRGKLFHALSTYQKKGLPKGSKPADYLASPRWEKVDRKESLRAGRMIFAMERLFRLHGIRYVEFRDLARHMLNVPIKYIYKERKLSSIGYAMFEKELFEALRIYNTLQQLAEETRHFILDRLIGDKVRIYGYEKTSGYLTYENRLKLILVGLLGSKKFRQNHATVCINFLELSRKIEKRYEAINAYLNPLSMKKLWEDKRQVDHFFKAKTGLLLRKEPFPHVLSLDFRDRINIPQKVTYMGTINNVEQLKNYFHYSLRSLRKHPYYTEDYELQLEQAFEKRLTEIIESMLSQTEKQMALIEDFEELHNLFTDLMERSFDLGFSEDQRHRLNDLYEFRKDNLKRQKLREIEEILKTVLDREELRDHWESIKWYLQQNRRFFGKEFENLIAKKFDEVYGKIAPSLEAS
ncbi:MAG: hypothetical protein DRH11_18555 [Deltaproteobacteria bacterium]|nr:MAG: hypothetical protein DRH11_18555 [Deltaproteobacteria bacterium]